MQNNNSKHNIVTKKCRSITMETIEESISAMDSIYDANFGDWIRNEANCKTVASNIKKYLNVYKSSEFIMVIKWIVKDWTLKSIINLMRSLITDELFLEGVVLENPCGYDSIYPNMCKENTCEQMDSVQNIKNTTNKTSRTNFEYKLNIVSGVIYTWNSLFIAEFVLTTSMHYTPEQKAEYFYNVLECFGKQKMSEILLQMEAKLDAQTKEKVIDRFTRGGEKRRRTGSILDAMYTH